MFDLLIGIGIVTAAYLIARWDEAVCGPDKAAGDRLAKLQRDFDERRARSKAMMTRRGWLDLQPQNEVARYYQPLNDLREQIAKVIYEVRPCEAGRFVDGFQAYVSGKISWEQAKTRDAEFGSDAEFGQSGYVTFTKFAYDAADAVMSILQKTRGK